MSHHITCVLILMLLTFYTQATDQPPCTAGIFGDKCQFTCSGNCANNATCDSTTGNCPGDDCMPGWEGKRCDKATDQPPCTAGIFGDKCQFTCSGNCANNATCDSSTGNCPRDDCLPGWEGKLCDQECRDGKYGVNCRKHCSDHCANGEPCGRFKGHCQNGCMAGWTGSRCDIEHTIAATQTTPVPADVTQYTYILYIAIVISSAVVISICIAVVCCRFRKTKKDKMQASSNFDQNPKENSSVFNTCNETYDSIYDYPIPQNIERPPSYRDHYEHEYGKLGRTDETENYVEIIE